ncbi:glycosyltransferase family 2 protein [Bacillus cereus]|nr:glycosyltransferase family 2 protein [Bacillus cereus]
MNITTMNHTEKDMSSHNSPKVSIIVATYRRKEALEQALQSLIAQTYSNFEIIVVDDNADAEWNTEIEKIVNNTRTSDNVQITYIQNKNNKGSSETRNIGIKLATGDYVTFLDDDDIYLPDKVKKQVKHMTKEGSDFSLTDLWLYDEKDKLVEKRIRDYIKDFSSESLMRYHLMYHMTGTDVMMFKKKYLIDIGLFSPINVGDEFYLMLKAIDGKGIFSYLPGCEVKAYVHSETDGLSSGDGKIKGENELYEYKKKYFNKLSQKERRYVKMRHYAVIAYAEFRKKRYFSMIKNSCLSLMFSPIKLIKLFINRK